MAISIVRVNIDPPVRSPIISLARIVTGPWHTMFSETARFIGRWSIIVDDNFDPPNVPAGATQAIGFSVKGVKPGDFLRATHTTLPWELRLDAVCTTADQVTLRFQNLDLVNAHDPPVGVLRIEWVALR